jgi:hypothetical protein
MSDESRGVFFHLFSLLEPVSSTLAGALATLGIQFVVVMNRVYRRHRDNQLRDVFISDMAHTHLPRIYDVLEKIADKQGIDPGPRPSIRFFDHKEMDS